MLLRHFIEYRVDKGQSILSSFLITSGCLDHIPTLFTTTESALRNPQWSWKILSDINSINFYIDAYIDSCNIWSYLPRSIYSTYFYIFLHISTLVSSFSSKFLGEFPRDPPMEGPGRWHGLLQNRRRRRRRRSFGLRLRSDGPRTSAVPMVGLAIGDFHYEWNDQTKMSKIYYNLYWKWIEINKKINVLEWNMGSKWIRMGKGDKK